MIFVTTGTQLPFDRLLRMMDDIYPSLGGEEILVQSFRGKYVPVNFDTVDFLHSADFKRVMNEARVIVAHAGIGTIMTAMNLRKPIVIVARDSALGEHRNDHQKATAEHLARRCSLFVATSAEEMLAGIREMPIPSPLPLTPSPELVTAITEILERH